MAEAACAHCGFTTHASSRHVGARGERVIRNANVLHCSRRLAADRKRETAHVRPPHRLIPNYLRVSSASRARDVCDRKNRFTDVVKRPTKHTLCGRRAAGAQKTLTHTHAHSLRLMIENATPLRALCACFAVLRTISRARYTAK